MTLRDTSNPLRRTSTSSDIRSDIEAANAAKEREVTKAVENNRKAENMGTDWA
jgi:hypothetical protein